MRKLTILLALAVVISSSSGCCCGRMRNWFHKGSPCGTAMAAPAVLGAPLAMGTPVAQPMSMPMMSSPVMASPMMSGPVMAAPTMCVEAMPQCCPPCDPCDPCGSGQVTSGYYGGYTTSEAGCDCAGGAPMSGIPAGATVVTPGPIPEG